MLASCTLTTARQPNIAKQAKEESVEDQMLYKLLQGILNATRPSCCLLGTRCPSLSSAFVCLPALGQGAVAMGQWGLQNAVPGARRLDLVESIFQHDLQPCTRLRAMTERLVPQAEMKTAYLSGKDFAFARRALSMRNKQRNE